MALASIFMCFPIADAWALQSATIGFSGKLAGHCYNRSLMWVFNNGYNVVTDVMIWGLPLVLFLNLRQIPVAQRLGIISVFSMGIVAVVASAIRFGFMFPWNSSPRQRFLNMPNIFICTQVELHAGLIAGSIPFLRPLYRQVRGRMRGGEQVGETPGERLAGECKQNVKPKVDRMFIIPSTSSDGSSTHEFRRPECDLEAIEPVHLYTHVWESTATP